MAADLLFIYHRIYWYSAAGAIIKIPPRGNRMFPAVYADTAFHRCFNFIPPNVPFSFPAGADSSMSSFHNSLQPSQACIRMRGYYSLFIARMFLLRLDTRRNTIYPICHGTISVMVIGIHIAAPEAAVFHNTIPMFPNRGSTFGHRIEPRGIFLPKQKAVS